MKRERYEADSRLLQRHLSHIATKRCHRVRDRVSSFSFSHVLHTRNDLR